MHLCAPAGFEFCSGQMYNRLQTVIAPVHPVPSLHVPHFPFPWPRPTAYPHLIAALHCHLNALFQENGHFSMLWIVQPEKSPFFHGCENGLFLLIIRTTNCWPWKGPFFCYKVPFPQLTLQCVFTLDEFRFGGVWVCYVMFCVVRLVYVTIPLPPHPGLCSNIWRSLVS